MRDDFEMMEMTNHILLLFIIIIYTHSNDVLMKHLIMCIMLLCERMTREIQESLFMQRNAKKTGEIHKTNIRKL